jgi:hypothetical protein
MRTAFLVTYFIVWGKLFYFLFYTVELTTRFVLAFYVIYLVLFEIYGVNCSYKEDHYFGDKKLKQLHTCLKNLNPQKPLGKGLPRRKGLPKNEGLPKWKGHCKREDLHRHSVFVEGTFYYAAVVACAEGFLRLKVKLQSDPA